MVTILISAMSVSRRPISLRFVVTAPGCMAMSAARRIGFTTSTARRSFRAMHVGRITIATLKHPPVELDAARRSAVEAAIRDTCEKRDWSLQAINVRTNHIHAVVTAPCKPEPVLSAFKANATRQMREDGCWRESYSPWSDKGSRRYLWKSRHVELAIDYVINGQGDDLPNFDDE